MKNNDSNLAGIRTKLDRRQFLATGLAFAATGPVFAHADPATADAQRAAPFAANPVTARAYGAAGARAVRWLQCRSSAAPWAHMMFCSMCSTAASVIQISIPC